MNKHSQHELQDEDYQNALEDLDTYIDVSLEDLRKINRIAQKHAQLRRTKQVMVRDIMSADVTTVSPDTPLKKAAQTLLDMRISGLPVIDQSRKLVGIVTEADFLAAMDIPSHHPTHSLWQTLESIFKYQPNPENIPDRVEDIMVKQVITISDDKTLHKVIDTMNKHHIKRIVVTNVQYQVQGIITRSNLMKVLLQKIL